MALSAGLILIGFMPAATLFVFQKALWMVLDSALALTLLLGFITAVLCASHCIRREMTNGTALLLLSKPVSRFAFIAAKIAGIDAAMAVFAVIFCSAAVIMGMTTAGMLIFEDWGTFSYFAILALCGLYGAAENYFRHTPFSARAVPALAIAMPLFALIVYFISATLQPLYDGPSYISLGRLIPALYLIFAALMLIGTISAAFATKFSF